MLEEVKKRESENPDFGIARMELMYRTYKRYNPRVFRKAKRNFGVRSRDPLASVSRGWHEHGLKVAAKASISFSRALFNLQKRKLVFYAASEYVQSFENHERLRKLREDRIPRSLTI